MDTRTRTRGRVKCESEKGTKLLEPRASMNEPAIAITHFCQWRAPVNLFKAEPRCLSELRLVAFLEWENVIKFAAMVHPKRNHENLIPSQFRVVRLSRIRAVKSEKSVEKFVLGS